MDKKQSERSILSQVYNANEYAEILEGEQPDFRLRHHGISSFFGVEVTEFYYSESNARLRNIPNYFNEIIDENRYRHKRDAKTLALHNIKIVSNEGKEERESRAIVQELPTPSQYASMVADAITTKGTKFKDYDRNLTHVNLIIQDTEQRLQQSPIGEFYRYFFIDELKSALYAAEFREIFLVTTIDKNRRVFFPLKMMLLVASFYLFGKVMLEYPWNESEEPSEPESDTNKSYLMTVFGDYLRAKTENALLRKPERRVEIGFGNCTIGVSPGNVVINDFNDFPYPAGVERIEENERTEFFGSEEFRENEKPIISKFTFSADIARDVKAKPNTQNSISLD